MKRFFTILSCILGLSVSAQVELHFEGASVGSTAYIDSASAAVDHFQMDMYLVNTGSTTLNVTYSRERRYNTAGWSDQICDNNLCYYLSDEDDWSLSSSATLSIPANDSSIFQIKVEPNDISGCSIYTYIIEGDNHTYFDSIQVAYTIAGQNCYLDVEDDKSLNKPELTVYPNPANNVVNVDVNYTGSDVVTVSILDIVGKEVATETLMNGKNTIDISHLNAGVYFYAVKQGGDIIETKKLVVR